MEASKGVQIPAQVPGLYADCGDDRSNQTRCCLCCCWLLERYSGEHR